MSPQRRDRRSRSVAAMTQPLRIDFEGAFHHVVARGNGRGPIFLDDVDFRVFLRTFAAVVGKCDWACHAFCLLPNHYHLLLEMREPRLSEGMQLLNGLYARRFNRRHQRQDHLFRARFRSVVVARESHALETARYIPLNPVHAGLCTRPQDWPWSSYAATAGLHPSPPFLQTSWLLDQFAREPKRARELYRRFVADGLSPAARLASFAFEFEGIAA